MNEPRRIAVHRSLNRPHLLMGAERNLVLLVAVVTAIVLFSGNISVPTIILGVSVWTVSFWALVRMAKADPQMSQVYQRHISYHAYYSARSCIDAMLPSGGRSKS
jgi:type IV secretory pathway TrbD component